MGVFGSGDKTSTSLDNRIGASDSAQAVGAGAVLFNASGSKQSTPTDYTPWIVGSVIALMLWAVFIRKI